MFKGFTQNNKVGNDVLRNEQTFWEDVVSKDNDEPESLTDVVKHLTHDEAKDIPSQNLMAIISDKMKVIGEIDCVTELKCSGVIEGNVHSTKAIILNQGSKVFGNIEAHSIFIDRSEVVGNISCDSDIIVEQNSRLEGNLLALKCTINGAVEGDIKVFGLCELKQNSIINGNIEAAQLTIQEGAIVLGKIKVTG